MDAQDFRNLQEAYLDVYENEQLDEVLDTPERATEYGKKALGSILGATVKGLITKDKKHAKTVEKRLEGVERAKRKAERKAAEEMKEGKVPWNDPKKPLESGHTPAEKNRAKRERTGVEDLSKSPTDKEYARYGNMKSVDDEQSSASNKNKSTHKFRDFPIRDNKGKKQTVGQLRRTRGTPKPESRDEKSDLYQSPIHKDDKRTRGGRLDQWKGPNPRKEEVDIYDIILSHLLDEGYADTQEAAEVIMVNMSEDWRESIIG
jgi:hypothetical protein